MVKRGVEISVCADLDGVAMVCDTGACSGAISEKAVSLQSLRDMGGSRLEMLLFDIASGVAKAWTFHVSMKAGIFCTSKLHIRAIT